MRPGTPAESATGIEPVKQPTRCPLPFVMLAQTLPSLLKLRSFD
jgi:hypothetical protein